MVTITDQRLRHTVYETVVDLLEISASTYNASSTPDIVAGYVDVNTITLPCIVVNPIEVEEPEQDKTIDTSRAVTTRMITVVIEVYTKKAEDLDNIADGLNYTFSNNNIVGVQYQNCQDNTGMSFPSGSKIRQRTMTLNFLRR